MEELFVTQWVKYVENTGYVVLWSDPPGKVDGQDKAARADAMNDSTHMVIVSKSSALTVGEVYATLPQ